MRLHKERLLVATIGLFALAVAHGEPIDYTGGTGIVGSPHDLRLFIANTTGAGQICVVCHAPHNGASWEAGLLWNHALSTYDGSYTLYSSPTLDGVIGQPTGSAKLCLSCHDGSVAIDQFDANTGSIFIDAFANPITGYNPEIGGDADLRGQHPISITYAYKADCTDTTVSGDCELMDPTLPIVGTASGVTLTVDDLLEDGLVQCASCHDVHNGIEVVAELNPKLLRVSKDGSQICLACHDK